MGLEFVATSNFASHIGGPDTILTCPDCRSLKKIIGDGSCLFRALCYIITGSEQQHFALRSAIVYHMLSFSHLFVSNGSDRQSNYITSYSHPRQYVSVEQYILRTRMDHETVCGINIYRNSLLVLHIPVYCYDASQHYHIWAVYFPNNVDRSIPRDTGQRSLFIYFHFQVITAVRSR